MIYFQLFLSFFQIGLFSFGGGYAAMPLIQHQLVTLHGWLNMTEFSDIITISQMTPGPIAVNGATFAGIRLAGIGGAFAATFGCILPSTVIAIILAKLYYKYRELSFMKGVMNGLRPAVVAMIASAGLSILMLALWNGAFDIKSTDLIAAGIFLSALAVLRIFKIDQIWVMLGAGVVGAVLYAVI